MGEEAKNEGLVQKGAVELVVIKKPGTALATIEAPIEILPTQAEQDLSARGALNGKRLLTEMSVHKERKKAELIEENNINEIDLHALLSKDDYEFYQEKKRSYLDYYPDLGNDPFDLDDLHLMIMEQVFQRNLLKRKRKHPTVDIAKDYEASVKRQGDLKKSLSMRRTDRVKAKQGPKTLNVANLSVIVADKEKFAALQAGAEQAKLEEDLLRLPEKVID